jgi:hypothetical protein
LAIVFGALFEVLLAPDTLSIAKTRLSERINVAPGFTDESV